MIDDAELRDLFRVESDERLRNLENGLLQLDEKTADEALLDDLFREAHSLKGAARMLGLQPIQDLAHELEDVLGLVRSGDRTASSDGVAGMMATLDRIRSLVNQVVGDESDGGAVIPSAAETAQAFPTTSQPGPPSAAVSAGATAQRATSDGKNGDSLSAKPADPALGASASVTHSAFRIETMRVDPRRLDALMTQSGELTVTRIRISRRMAELDQLAETLVELHQMAMTDLRETDSRECAGALLETARARMEELRAGAREDCARLDYVADQIDSGVRALRLVPMATLFALFPRFVRDLALDLKKELDLVVEGDDTVADKRVLEDMKDPLMHMLRNAVDHGIEPPERREALGKPRKGTVRVRAHQGPGHVLLEVSDDGQGLDPEELRRIARERGGYRDEELAAMSVAQLHAMILNSGFSTARFVTDVSGRGVGLDVVRSHIERLKGTLAIDSVMGKGMTLRAELPTSLATAKVLVVAAAGHRFALPVEHVLFARKLPGRQIYTVEGHQTITIDGQPVSVARLDRLLELAPPDDQGLSGDRPMLSPSSGTAMPCVVFGIGQERFGVTVDAIVDVTEVVLKPQSPILKRVRNVAGATILETGEVCMVLNPHDLLTTLGKASTVSLPSLDTGSPEPTKKIVLLAEDSVTTRTQEKRILEGAGYEVVAAVDGADAFSKLGTRRFDAVVSDVVMPNMTGLELAEKIRADRRYAELPIILVTSMASDEDKRRGMEAGANAYLFKPTFDQRLLLDCLARFV